MGWRARMRHAPACIANASNSLGFIARANMAVIEAEMSRPMKVEA